MGVTALLMAGGRGSRMGGGGEKPLVKVGGKSMIERVLEALEGASKVDDIIIAVSKYTPRTAAYARERGLKILQTPGEGFCLDVRYAIKRLKPGGVLTVCADLPLITSEFIDKVVTHYERCGKTALTVMAPIEIYRKLGLSADYVFTVEGRELVPVGINVIDGGRIRERALEGEILIVEDERIVINVNTLEDLKIAERMLRPNHL